MKLTSGALKSAVGHDYVNENEVLNWNFINHQLIKIKFTFRDRLNGNEFVADKEGDNWTASGWGPEFGSAYWHETFSDRETVHNKTWNPWLVKTEVD